MSKDITIQVRNVKEILKAADAAIVDLMMTVNSAALHVTALEHDLQKEMRDGDE